MTTAITSIAELNVTLRRARVTIPVTSFEQKFLDLPDKSVAEPFRRLLIIKPLSRNDPGVIEFCNKQRERQQTQQTSFYVERYQRTIAAISQDQGGIFEGNRVRRFFDLGYSPGGFSSWLLNRNPSARGVGIDKNASEGSMLENEAGRYTIRTEDIITLVLQSVENGEDPIIPLAANDGDGSANHYDLVIAGAFPVGEGHIEWWIRLQLVLSQLLLVLINTTQGGASIILVNTKPFCWMAEEIGILRHSFEQLTAKKGDTHKKSSSCYLICTGFRASMEDVQKYGAWIKKMLVRLQARSREEGAGRVFDAELTMPTISGRTFDEIFDSEHQKVLELFTEPWNIQYKALKGMFENIISKNAASPTSAKSFWGSASAPAGRNRGAGADSDSWL
ncbi:unnamed protein product [Somion occarium]|uniref:Ribosomal RNA methyltransferase FtsJ domain-containing protein n=1 Tax=Somion occarium TaxID=3059160 RepID=A0ABP1DVE9_9APHY